VILRTRVGPVLRRGRLDRRDDRSESRVIGVHPVEQVAGGRVRRPYERPQSPILAAVVVVQKVHHPADVVGQRDALHVPSRSATGRCSPSGLARRSGAM
jgi:hypothetical protein